MSIDEARARLPALLDRVQNGDVGITCPSDRGRMPPAAVQISAATT